MGCGTGKLNKITQNVLVVGATGNIGQAAVYELHRLNVNVTAGVRDLNKEEAQEFRKRRINTTQIDMSSSVATLTQKMRGYEAVYLVTPGHIDRAEITLNAARAAKEAGVRYILTVSVPVVGLDNTFGRQFKVIEEGIKLLGVSYGFLRLPMFTDNNFGNIATIKSDGIIYGPIPGNVQFATVTVKDAAQVAAAVLSTYQSYHNKTLTVTSDKKSYDELAKDFSFVLNKPVQYVQAGYQGAKQAMITMGMPEWQVDGVLELYQLAEKKDLSQTTLTNTFKNIIGYNSTTNIEWIKANEKAFEVKEVKQNILVLGASGYIGTATVKSLLEKNANVTAGIRQPSKLKQLEQQGAKIIKADMGQSQDELSKVLVNYNILFIVTPGHIDRTKLTINAIRAAKQAKVEYVLIISVPTINHLDTCFGRQFNEIESELKRSGLNYGIMRLPMFTDNLYGNASAIISHNTFYGPVDGHVRHATVAVSDAANAAAEILTDHSNHKNKTYTIVSDLESLDSQAKSFGSSLGRQIKYVNGTYEGTKKALLAFMPEWQVDGVLELYKLAEQNDSSQTTMTNHYQWITGKNPTSNAEWMKNNKNGFSPSS